MANGKLHVPGYQVMEFLGSGARSTIWRVKDVKRNAYYALKRVTRQDGDDDRFILQALNEHEVAIKFDHPVLRRSYRVRRIRKWLTVSELHLFMELCDGMSCHAQRPSEPGDAVRVFFAVSQGLGHMHSRGFVHADMKPNNIIVGPDGAVKVIDFGQSCPIGTVKERIQGTPDFIAPEQVYRRPLDARTDVFNLGAALYWVLTGQAIPTILPKGESLPLLNDLRVTPPERINPQVPPSLSRLVLDCIELNVSRRPQNMKEVAARLDMIAHTLSTGTGLPLAAADSPAPASADPAASTMLNGVNMAELLAEIDKPEPPRQH